MVSIVRCVTASPVMDPGAGGSGGAGVGVVEGVGVAEGVGLGEGEGVGAGVGLEGGSARTDTRIFARWSATTRTRRRDCSTTLDPALGPTADARTRYRPGVSPRSVVVVLTFARK